MVTETLVHLLRDNYTEAKVRAKKGFLLDRQQLYSLTEFRNQTEVLGFLADGPYGPELSKLQESTSPADAERAVRHGLARTVENLISSAKGEVKDFLLEYNRRFDAYDLGTLLIYKSQGRTWEEYSSATQPVSPASESWLRRLYSTEDPEMVATKLGDKTVESRLEGIPFDELTPDKAALVRDILNGWGEERFFKHVDKNLHGRDRASCLPIVGTSVDLANVSVILRSKLIGIANVQHHLIPIGWRLRMKVLGRLSSVDDLAQAIEQAAGFRHYRGLLFGLRQKYDESKSLASLELGVRRYLADVSRKVLLNFPNSIGVVLGFLTLKENESRNIAAIISGVAAGLKPEAIRPLLVA